MLEEPIALLGELGFARNEALAYLTLLEAAEKEGMTGYEVASQSGIPRSAVYTVLRKLENQGAAFAVGGKPARYLPLSPKRLLEQIDRATRSRLDRVDAGLRRIPRRSLPEPVWIISRYGEVLARADAMIRSAEESVYISVWDRELTELLPALRTANGNRRLHRVLHSPDRICERPPGFSCWIDDVSTDEQKAAWSHKVLAVVDRREALIGGSEPEADNQAVYTRNPSLVDVATNHVILDITMLSQRNGRECRDDVALMMRPHLT